MQKQEPGKSNLKLYDRRVTGANLASRKHFTSPVALWLIAASLLTSVNAQETNKTKPEQAPTTTVINLWPGVAPGSEEWKQPETTLSSPLKKSIQ
jgi:hypothetical protein